MESLGKDIAVPIKVLETDNFIMTEEPNMKGAYTFHFKSAAIPKLPVDEEDRERQLIKLKEKIDKKLASMKSSASIKPE